MLFRGGRKETFRAQEGRPSGNPAAFNSLEDLNPIWGVPKIRGTFLGVPIIRVIV